MKVLKTTNEYKVDTEQQAIELINGERSKATEGGYSISKATYSYKSKKAKGEIIAEGYLVSITRNYEGFWDEE